MDKQLSDKQKRFIAEYLVDYNVCRAAARVGVSKRMAFRYKRNPAVRAAIDVETKKLQDNLDNITAGRVAAVEEIRLYLTSVMRGESLSGVVVLETTDRGTTKAVVIYKPPDEKERLRAAELLGKHYGVFTHKVSLDVKPVVIKDDLND